MRGRRGPRRRFKRRPPPPKQGPKRRPPRQLNPRLQRELKRANRLMRNGEHANAAQIFVSLGERAQDRGILQPAGRLFLQAGMALLMANQIEASLEEAHKGLRLLAANEQWSEFEIEGQRLVEAYGEMGADSAAESLQTFLEDRGRSAKPNKAAEEGKLPAKCPFCGASLSLEQIRSGGEQATECKYCGSIVLAQKIR